jgi:hypothetical protein
MRIYEECHNVCNEELHNVYNKEFRNVYNEKFHKEFRYVYNEEIHTRSITCIIHALNRVAWLAPKPAWVLLRGEESLCLRSEFSHDSSSVLLATWPLYRLNYPGSQT